MLSAQIAVSYAVLSMRGLAAVISRAVNDNVVQVVLEHIESRDTWIYRFYGLSKRGVAKVKWSSGARIGSLEVEVRTT